MLDPKDLRDYVIAPVLYGMENLWGKSVNNPAAINLLLGIAAHESTIGIKTRLKQVRGPARGIFQIEPASCYDVFDNYLGTRPDKASYVRGWAQQKIRPDRPFITDLTGNLHFQVCVARLILWRRRFEWPTLIHPGTGLREIDGSNIDALADIWKNCWNTVLGKGTVEQFKKAYPTI